MDIIKRLFSFNNDDTSAIGLCKFNDDLLKMNDAKERLKRKFQKDANLTNLLRRKA